MRIIIGVGYLVQRTGDNHISRVLSGQTIERSNDAVCSLHCACGDEECEFLGWASKPRSTVCQWFDLNTIGTLFSGLASKPEVEGFSVWASKPVAMVWWFGPQNYRDGLLVWALKPSGQWFVGCASKPAGGCDGAGHALRYSGFLRVEANQVRISQFASKLTDAWRWVVHMASSQRLRRGQVEDGWVDTIGCVRPFYPTFDVFIVLGCKGSLVI
jgi:hypothetical protein